MESMLESFGEAYIEKVSALAEIRKFEENGIGSRKFYEKRSKSL